MTDTHEGHRERLLSRYERNGIAGLHDYEILELFLTFVITRKDTKPIAKALLARYKTISAVVHAPAKELTGIEGVGRRVAGFLGLVREIASYCLQEKYQKQPLLTRREDVYEFLRFHFSMKRDEYVAALFLDNGNQCIATEILAEGTVNQCALYPRHVVERGLAHGAASFILAHNHPGGALTPSKADWSITERLYAVGRLLDMPLLDHVIVSHDSIVSLRDFPQWPGK